MYRLLHILCPHNVHDINDVIFIILNMTGENSNSLQSFIICRDSSKGLRRESPKDQKMSWFYQLWNRQFENYSGDDNYTWEIGFTRFVFTIAGFWPGSKKINLITFPISLTIIFIFLILPQILEVPDINNERELFISLSFIFYRAYSIGCMLCLRFKIDIFKSILEDFRQHWNTRNHTEDRKIMHHYAKLSKIISIITSVTIGIIAYNKLLSPLAQDIIKGKKLKMIPGHSSYPFPLSDPLVFAACYLAEFIVITGFSMITIGMDNCFAVLIFHACGQLKILGNKIKRYQGKVRHPGRNDAPGDCNCLKCIVDFHVKTCELVKKINNFYNSVAFLKLWVSVSYFCFIGFNISKAVESKNYTGLFSNALNMIFMMVALFLYCQLGGMCQEINNGISDIAFNSEWMQNPRNSRDIILIIRQANIPLKITAANFFVLSRSFFKEYIVTSMSYLSVLITVRTSK
ncbi:uncharacterized protein [Fopius arisanus]|uniref:Odorant receptor n=1 Tax=Fopius arisanus TaxID=64838 RepID=A0A9R1T977_9HYME|nr:PREDICTED: uncharacterized protein LOC105267739 [Fopius arisanus]